MSSAFLFDTVLGETRGARLSRRLQVGWLMAAVAIAQLSALGLLPARAFEPAVTETPDPLGILVFDPAPAAPPPLPKGSPRGSQAVRTEAAKPAVQEPPQAQEAVALPLTPLEVPKPAEPELGSETGREHGDPSGMDGGIDDGMVGGRPGGSPNGVPNATGADLVSDYDAPPRLVRQIRPRYPTEAFVQKIQGTVLLEIVIDPSGHVSQARVIQSIPLLDAAARDAVREWVFQPAMKRGRPVPAIAFVPVGFRIY